MPDDMMRPAHPWLDTFGGDPDGCFDSIVRGVAIIPPYGRADALTVLPSLFGPLHDDDPLRHDLDRAAIHWLDRWRRLPHPERRDYGLKRYWRDAVEALTVVQLVHLPETRAALRDRYFDFLQWADQPAISSAIDPRARFWFALAEEQPTERFRSVWYGICRKVGEGIYPAHYLGIGLLGLRRLPGEERDVLQHVIGGLAAWATHLPETRAAKREFLDQWRVLQWIYTRPNRKAWLDLVEPALEKHEDKPFAAWWAEALRIGGPRRGGRRPVHEPDRWEVRRFLAAHRGKALVTARPEIRRLIRARLHFAEATGDAHDLVLSSSQIADRVLDHDAGLAAELVSQALNWEPNDPILWNLWGRALTRLGRTRMAEAVFWEAARRFPDDEPSLVELARLLKGLDRFDEAEAVLREAVHRFPDNEQSHLELARLLAAAGRAGEAIDLLRDAVQMFRDDEQSHVELARMLARQGERDEAIGLLRGYVARRPDNPISLNSLGHLLVHAGRVEEARPVLDQLRDLGGAQREVAELSNVIARADRGQPVPMPAPDYGIAVPVADDAAGDATDKDWRVLLNDSRVTRADFGLGRAGRILTAARLDHLRRELRAVLAEAPDNAYARVVSLDRLELAEEEVQGLLADFPRLFELRLAVALRCADADALTRLAQDHPERAPVVALAQIALGKADAQSLSRAATWLSGNKPPADDVLGAYVYRAARAALTGAGAALDGPDAIADGLSAAAPPLLGILGHATRLGGLRDPLTRTDDSLAA